MTMRIAINGLECFGRHGVLPAEQELGQRFIVDVEIELAGGPASETDDLADTIDYAALTDAIAAIVEGPPVALLERLAARIVERVLDEPHASAACVTVRKPHVALSRPVRDVAVTLRRVR